MTGFPIPPEGHYWKIDKSNTTDTGPAIHIRLVVKKYATKAIFDMSSDYMDYGAAKPDVWPPARFKLVPYPPPPCDGRWAFEYEVQATASYVPQADVVDSDDPEGLLQGKALLMLANYEVEKERERRLSADVVLDIPPEMCGVGVKSARETDGGSDV